ncbi:hypothetical protein [Curtobacterium sp. RRHDQ10]|uniref:hypothetical protein n=1 Tax=Curtobacterium phyllosphaerae TaxID=3413379 RepID=UPI003BF1D328
MSARNPRLQAHHDGEQMASTAFARLPSPETLTVDGIVAHVATLRRRPISVVELPTLAGTTTCGWWNAREHDDEILIAPTRSARHRDALVLHEIGHLVLDLTGVVVAADTTVLPGTVTDDRGGVLRARRSHFDDATEIAAELLADAFARLIRRGPPRLSQFLSVFS